MLLFAEILLDEYRFVKGNIHEVVGESGSQVQTSPDSSSAPDSQDADSLH